MAEEKVTYKRRIGTDCDHGVRYEWDTTCLACVRTDRLHRKYLQKEIFGIKKYLLANNVSGIGAIDDVVARVEYNDGEVEKIKLIFVQCKHVQDAANQKHEKNLISQEVIKKLFESFVTLLHILKDDDEGISRAKLDEIERKNIENEIKKLEKVIDCTKNDLPNKTKENDGQSLENTVSNTIKENRNQRNKFRDIFNCKISDCEIVLYTNFIKKEGLPVIENGIKDNNMDISERDISYEIFNTADSFSKPITLDPKTLNLKKNINVYEGEWNYLKVGFAKIFRIFYSQVENIEYEIVKSITRNHLSENVTLNLIEELKLLYGTKDCEFLDENSDLVKRVKNFSLLKLKSTKVQEDLFCDLSSKSLFSTDGVEDLNEKIKPKDTSEIPTSSVELEKRKLIQLSHDLFKAKKEKNLIVFIDNKSDFDTWKLARTTKIYDNFNVFIVCSDISIEFPELKNNEFGIKFILRNECNDALEIDKLRFSEKTIELISNSSVSFQDVTVKINEIWENTSCIRLNEKLLLNILTGKNIKIEKPQLPALECNAQRKFNVKVLNNNFAQSLNNDLPTMNKGHVFLLVSEKSPEYTQKFENIGDVRESIKELKKTTDDDTMHFCLRHTDGLELLHSFGKESEVTEHINMKEKSYNVHENKKITILSGARRSGKTSTLHSLACQNDSKNPSHWNYFIDLKNCSQQFQDLQIDDDTTKSIQFLATKILNLKNLESFIFENGKNVIFFDSFDKLVPDARKKFISLLFELEKTKLSHIFVTSETNYARELENAFSYNAIQLTGTVTM